MPHPLKTCPHCGANLDPGEHCDCVLQQMEDAVAAGYVLHHPSRGEVIYLTPEEHKKLHAGEAYEIAGRIAAERR